MRDYGTLKNPQDRIGVRFASPGTVVNVEPWPSVELAHICMPASLFISITMELCCMYMGMFMRGMT